MKHSIFKLLFLFFLFGLGFSGNAKAAQTDYNTALIPIWTGDIVYNESVLPLSNSDGSIEPISLLYKGDHIISVKSATLDITYREGVDYKLENGKLVILPTGSIPILHYDEYYLPGSTDTNAMPCTNGGAILFDERGLFHNAQLAVTYSHSDKWHGTVPQGQKSVLNKTITKLENKETTNILFFGDSITVGANASDFLQISPYMKIWPEMVVDSLQSNYQNSNIQYSNHSVGGMGSEWGALQIGSIQ